jgi:TIR domain
MPNGSQGIFLSYRRDDAGVSASLLRMCLEQYLPGTQVFRDAESIEPGANFRTRIEDAIKSSAVLLALIGPSWLTAADVAGRRRLFDPDDVLVWEIALALRLGVRVIPVLVQAAPMPPAKELPAALRDLADLQAVPLDHRYLDVYQTRVRYLAAAIERIQLEFARARQEREQRPNGSQVLDRQTPIPRFAERIKEIRIGDPQHPPAPANTMATLRIFAQERDVDELLQLWPASEEAGGFAPLDAVAILTLAAVDRTPAKAAELTVGLRRAEQGGSGLTESIIHDLTAQRTVPDLAEFIAECRRCGQADLVEETLMAFVRSASRTSLDKALLYFELLRFQCADEATTLLARTLSAEGARPRAYEGTPSSAADRGGRQRPLAGVIGQVGIVGALRHLSPSQAIVEEWIDERMTASVNWRETADLVANLLGNEPNGDLVLAKHVATKWDPPPLIRLCEVLAGSAHRASPGLPLVRRYAATRHWSSLAGIIGSWYLSPELSGSFSELIAEIVRGGADGPELRPIHFFDNLAAALDQPGVPPKCRSELLVAAATYVTGRPGADVAELLRRVGRADRRRAAQGINGRFAQGLVKGEMETGLFIDYLKGLKPLPDYPTLIFWAVRELTDPADPTDPNTANRRKLTGWQIGGIAVRIYADGPGDTGFDLLERYLENEQAVTATDAADLVAQVHTCAEMQDARWDALLGATIGRWADTDRLDEVRDEFLKRNYRREAAAIMSLFQ